MIYSQNDEQLVIEKYFGDEIGTFLDCGANNGICLSNTRSLALKGWSGLLLEPSPEAFAHLSELYANDYPRIEIIEAAIHTANEEVILHHSGTHLNQGDVSLLSSISEQETKRWANTTNFTPIQIFGFTLEAILDSSNYQTFDFISIDIEGREMYVLNQFDFHKLKTKMICIEWNSNLSMLGFFNGYILPFGFELIDRNNENLIYALPKN